MKFLGVSLAALIAAAPAMAEDSKTVWRVFIGDHAAPKITAFDLSAPDRRWNFDVTGQAKLYPIEDGSGIVAVQSDNDTVAFLSSGLKFESHGDHSDISVSDPSQVAAILEGPRPFHVVNHDGQVTINFDKGGYAMMLPQSAIAEGKIEPARFEQAKAHHGFVTPFGDTILSTVASASMDETAPRLGLQAFSDGKPVGDPATCTGIHGEAFSGSYLTAGCKEGVLTVNDAADGPEFGMIPYPADLPPATTGTLIGSHAMQVFLGNYGADGVAVIDPADAPHFRYVKLPFRRVDFTLDPARPQFAYILTEDGSLHRLNMLDARIEDSTKVTEPYSMDGHWADARPRLAVAGDQILVTDPAQGELHAIDTATWQGRTITVEGRPFNIAVVGGSGMTH